MSRRKLLGAGPELKVHQMNAGADFTDHTQALTPPNQIPIQKVRTSPSNPRYQDLLQARIIQPAVEAGERSARSSHIAKLSKNRILVWAQRVKTTWLLTESGKAWLAEEAKQGHVLNFDMQTDQERLAVWRAYLRRWIARQSRFLSSTVENTAWVKRTIEEWQALIGLCGNISEIDFIQPLKVNPSNGVFEIVGGERRYWASRLNCLEHVPVTGGPLTRLEAARQTMHENFQRKNPSIGATIVGMRNLFEELTGQPCGPTNNALKISTIENEFSSESRSWAVRMRAILRLPADSELLQRIINNEFSNVLEIDTVVREWHRTHKSGLDNGANGGEPGGAPPAANGSTPPKAAGASSRKSTTKPQHPIAKVRLPGTVAGLRMFDAIKAIEGLKEPSLAALDKATSGWAAAHDKQRAVLLQGVIDAIVGDTEQLDLEDEGSHDGA